MPQLTQHNPEKTNSKVKSPKWRDPLTDPLSDPIKQDPLSETTMSGMGQRNMDKRDLNSGGKQAGVALGSTLLEKGTETTLNQTTSMDTTSTNGIGDGLGTGFIGLAKFGKSVNGIKSGFDKKKEGRENNDKALEKIGTKEIKQNSGQTLKEGIGLTNTTLSTVKTVSDLGSTASKFIPGLSVISNVLSGGIATRQLVKLVKRQKGLGKEDMATSRGKKWKSRISGRTEAQARMSKLKIALAGLGIVGTTVALLSNPVGWLIGIVSALGGAGIALHKLGKTMNDKYKTVELTKTNRMLDRAFETESPGLSSMSRLMTKDLRTKEGHKRRIEDDGTLIKDDDTFNPQDLLRHESDELGKNKNTKFKHKNKKKTGFEHLYKPTEKKDNGKLTKKRRKELKAEADAVQRMVSKMAALGGELQTALKDFAPIYWRECQQWSHANQKLCKMRGLPKPLELSEKALQYQDAVTLLEILGMTPEEMTSDTGQTLFERKMLVNA